MTSCTTSNINASIVVSLRLTWRSIRRRRGRRLIDRDQCFRYTWFLLTLSFSLSSFTASTTWQSLHGQNRNVRCISYSRIPLQKILEALHLLLLQPVYGYICWLMSIKCRLSCRHTVHLLYISQNEEYQMLKRAPFLLLDHYQVQGWFQSWKIAAVQVFPTYLVG